MGSKITTTLFIERANTKFNYLYDYTKAVYVQMHSKVEIICNIHGSFFKTPAHHLSGQGCPACSRQKELERIKNLAFSTQAFIDKATVVHGSLYCYDDVEYINYVTKVKIFCKKHNCIFLQAPAIHLSGKGCPRCGKEKAIDKNSFTKDEFILKANQVHNYKYDYILEDFCGIKSNINIFCRIHQKCFTQLASNHLSGSGCPSCGQERTVADKKYTIDEFINICNKIHQNYYNYSKVEYKNNSTKVIILCPKHGVFSQLPSNHLDGHGCPTCVRHISKKEIQWLDDLDISIENRQKTIRIGNDVFLADGFDPTTNTIYEFYGDYWHGNPLVFDSNKINDRAKMTFGELYRRTINREIKIIQAGFKLITIWELDFDNGKIHK